MVDYNEFFQSADWKMEKNAPVIEVKSKDPVLVEVSVGKEIEHPSTVEHHIRWISVYFHPHGEKFSYHIGHFECNAHGESAQGANQGPVYTNSCVVTSMKTDKPGTLLAASLVTFTAYGRAARSSS